MKAALKSRKPAHWAALLAASLCSPAFAASTVENACDEEAAPLHEVAVSEIAADPASHDHDMSPHVEALIREAFGADDATAEPADAAEDTVEEIAIRDAVDRSLPVTLPGVSGNDIELYKRRMYRTDI